MTDDAAPVVTLKNGADVTLNYGSDFNLSDYVDVTVFNEEEGQTEKTTSAVSFKSSPHYQIQLWNSSGLIKTIQTDQPSYQLDLTGVPPGFYYVHVIKDGQTYRRQLVVQ